MTKIQALDKLEKTGSHLIVDSTWANEIGEPFGLKFQSTHFKPTNDPKGPMNECEGVDIHLIARKVAEAVGGDSRSFYGRGSQFREDIRSAREALKAKATV